MIATLLSVVTFVIGVIMYASYNNRASSEWLYLGGLLLTSFGWLASFICVIAIICAHADVNQSICKAQIERKTLVSQLEVSKDSTDKIAYVTATENVMEWNAKVADKKYYQSNMFLSWFFSKKYVDSLEYIEVE